MSVKINTTDQGVEVNGKAVYQDTNGNWIASQELTMAETRAFNIHRLGLTKNIEVKEPDYL